MSGDTPIPPNSLSLECGLAASDRAGADVNNLPPADTPQEAHSARARNGIDLGGLGLVRFFESRDCASPGIGAGTRVGGGLGIWLHGWACARVGLFGTSLPGTSLPGTSFVGLGCTRLNDGGFTGLDGSNGVGKGLMDSSPTGASGSEKENAYIYYGRTRGKRVKAAGGRLLDTKRAASFSEDDFYSSSTAIASDADQQTPNPSLKRMMARNPASRSVSCLTPAAALDRPDADAPAFLAEKRLRSRRSEGWLRKASRPRRLSGPPPRTASDGSSKYVEHLESQVVSLQTQLQTFTSPAAIHSQASKLRSITAEKRALQQDLAAWEAEFDERMEEQTQQHALIASSLRAQVRNLENERRRGLELQQELALELEQKLKEVETLEEAKVDLERRLDFMSEIMARSTQGNLNLYSDPEGGEGTVQAKRRPASYIQPRSTNDFAPDPRRWPSRRESGLSPTRAGPLYHRWRPSIDTSTSTSGQTEPDSDVSETTPIEANDWRARGRGESFTLQRASTDSVQRAPARKMRKFHSGSHGPRSLILAPSSPSTDAPLSPAAMCSGALSASSASGEGGSRQRFANESLLCSMDEVLQSENNSALTTPVSPKQLGGDFRGAVSSQLGDAYKSTLGASALGTTSLGTSALGTSALGSLGALRGHESEGEDSETILAASPESTDKALVVHSKDHKTDESQPTTAQHHQMSLISRIMTRLSGNLDAYASPARSVFEHTWQTARPVLLRPVIEFRWWLVQLLLGDMSRKHAIWLRRQLVEGRPRTPPRLLLSSISGAERAIGIGMTIAEPPPYSPPLSPLSGASPLEQRRRSVPQAPPMTWLKFSMTLILAVGIAIKDGPASLFAPRE